MTTGSGGAIYITGNSITCTGSQFYNNAANQGFFYITLLYIYIYLYSFI